jgi:hypothetical protein
MDVGGWLRGLGLGQYETNFRDNKIDAGLLPRLTIDDLKDIGVSAVGDRRRLLDAITVLAKPQATDRSRSRTYGETAVVTHARCRRNCWRTSASTPTRSADGWRKEDDMTSGRQQRFDGDAPVQPGSGSITGRYL